MDGIFDLPRLGKSYDNGVLIRLLEPTGVPIHELREIVDALDARDGEISQTVTVTDELTYEELDFIVSGSLRSDPSPGRRVDDVYNVKQILTHKLIDNRVGGASSIPIDAFEYSVQRSARILGANLDERNIAVIARELAIEEGDGAGIMPRYYSEPFNDHVAAYISNRFPGMIPDSDLGLAAKAIAISFDQSTYLVESTPSAIADNQKEFSSAYAEPLYLSSMGPVGLENLFNILAQYETNLHALVATVASDPVAKRYVAALLAEVQEAGFIIMRYRDGETLTIASLSSQLQRIQTLLYSIPESTSFKELLQTLNSPFLTSISQALTRLVPSANGAARVVAPMRSAAPHAGAVAGVLESAYISWSSASAPAKACVVVGVATLIFLGIVLVAKAVDQ